MLPEKDFLVTNLLPGTISVNKLVTNNFLVTSLLAETKKFVAASITQNPHAVLLVL